MTTTIEAGRWYRRRSDGLVVRADRPMGGPVGAVGWWALTPGDVGRHAVYRADLEPWVPRVGEWVRVGNGSAWRVEVVGECGAAGRGPTGVYAAAFHAIVPCAPPAEEIARSTAASEVCCEDHDRGAAEKHEPCAPPAIEALPPPSPEHLAAWAALGALSAPTPPRRDDGTRCHRCGGPAYTGLGTGGPPECLAPRCEPRSELEPTVRERWLTRTEGVFAIPVPGGERVWWAIGHGWTTMHPIRAEAVRLWREAVERG